MNPDISILVTNTGFDDEVKKEAEKYSIKIIEADALTRMYNDLGCKSSIDESINSINPDNLKNIIYI